MTKKKIIIWGVVLIVAVLFLSSLGKKKEPPVTPKEPAVPYVASVKPVSKNDRILGIDINTAEDNNFEHALTLAKGAGSRVVSLSINWSDFERSPGIYGADTNWLAIADGFYPAQGMKLALTLRPIDTNGKQVPADLKNVRFDNPVFIQRFEGFVDYVFSQTTHITFVSLAIGNEVDIGIGKDKDLWAEYETFYREVAKYVKTKRPDLKVGVTASMYGLTGAAKDKLLALNQYSGVVMTTYYPINEDFTVKDPRVVKKDIEALVNVYPHKPIQIKEIGYPSSEVLDSSNERQAEFVKQVFESWDAYATQISYVSFSWLTDRPKSELDSFAKYYNFSGKNFIEYLKTLGLRTYDGAGIDKPAMKALRIEAHQRGW